MPSSTEAWRAAWSGSVRDTGHLVAFRARTVRRRGPAVLGVLVVLALTVVFATVPTAIARASERATADGTSSAGGQVASAFDDLLAALTGNLGPAFVGFVALAVTAAVGSGGGRELLARSEAAIHPVSPVTEHLGALVLAPVNLAWLVQVWGLLAVTALVTPAEHLLGSQVVVLAWVLAATAFGQALGWTVEGVRRTAHGVLVIRLAGAALALAALGLHLAGWFVPAIEALPTTALTEAMQTTAWPALVLLLVALAGVGVVVGAVPAAWALGLAPREELRVQSGVHEARPAPEPRWGTPEAALLRRLDRGSVWRSVGMRRGLMVLGVGPGLIALVAGLQWSSVMLLPGLTASGAALLFGVNAWCLDGRGMVWRETLPVSAARVFDVRTLVVAECLAGVSGVTLVLALLRNGVPPLVTGVAVATCWAVVLVQVLAIAMTWSVRSPYAVDLSSPRATPAPHGAMAGYAGRLSLTTTLTAMLFTALASLPWAWLPVLVGVPFLLWSGRRLRRARRVWLAADARAQVVLTVAAA